MTSESIAVYIQYEIDRGASRDSIRNFKRVTGCLFIWLPEDKTITKDRLTDWRQFLKDHGYTPQTEMNYIKGINRYLDYTGCSDIRFNRGRAKDIARKQFGWTVKITYQKVTYQLGSFESIEEAIAVRQEAEIKLEDDSGGFFTWVSQSRKSQSSGEMHQ